MDHNAVPSLGMPQLPLPPLVPPASPPADLLPQDSLEFLFGSPAPSGGRGAFEPGFLWFDVPPPTNAPIHPSLEMGLQAGGGECSGVQPPLQASAQLEPQPPVLLQVAGGLLGHGGVPEQQQWQLPAPHVQRSSRACGGRGAGARAGKRGAAGQQSAVEQRRDEEDRRAEERRARNRATQARYRERQKAKDTALLQEHASLEADLELSHSQHQQLSVENAVLQKMLCIKDATIASLGGAPGQGERGSEAGAAAAPPGIQQPSQLQMQLQQMQRQQQQQQQRWEAVAEAGETADSSSSGQQPRGILKHPSISDLSGVPLNSVVEQRMEHIGMDLSAHMAQLQLPASAHPDEAMAAAGARLACSPTRPTLLLAAGASSGGGDGGGAAEEGGDAGGHSGRQQQDRWSDCHGGSLAQLMLERPDLVEQVKGRSPEAFVEQWRQRAKCFKDLFERYAATRSEAELEKIPDLLREFSVIMSLTLLLKPDSVQALFATAADAPPGLWQAVAGSLEFTHAQRTMLQQLWHWFAARMASIRTERATALQEVQHAAQHSAGPAGAAVTLPESTLGALMSRYLALFDAAGKLSTLRDAELVAMLQLLGRTGAVFSPVQKARMAAASHPHFPDIVQVARLVAESAEPAVQLEHVGEPGSQVWPPPQQQQQQQQQR